MVMRWSPIVARTSGNSASVFALPAAEGVADATFWSEQPARLAPSVSTATNAWAFFIIYRLVGDRGRERRTGSPVLRRGARPSSCAAERHGARGRHPARAGASTPGLLQPRDHGQSRLLL